MSNDRLLISKILYVVVLSFFACNANAKSNLEYGEVNKSKFAINDIELNDIYKLAKDFSSDSKFELNHLVDSQKKWLVARNKICKFNNESNVSESVKSCLNEYNVERTKFIKDNYFNFNKIENNILKPFQYTKSGVRKLADGGCWCNESLIKIEKNKIYVYQVCDRSLKQPRILNILNKKLDATSVEYEIDSNNDHVVDYTLSFVTTGRNVWNIVPKVYNQKELINLNFSISYTIDNNIEEEELDCSDGG